MVNGIFYSCCTAYVLDFNSKTVKFYKKNLLKYGTFYLKLNQLNLL